MSPVRVAAVADLHMGPDAAGVYSPFLADLGDHADCLLMAGDLTRVGSIAEAEALAAELEAVDLPMVGVLGNHDYHSGLENEVCAIMKRAGMALLEGEATVIEAGGMRVGVAGSKGFGGGFLGASGSDFGEPQMKAFIGHTRRLAEGLSDALQSLQGCCDVRIALMHYSPVPDTLEGERREIYPFLGSYILGEAVDAAGADLVVHGHAHGGSESGTTAGGIPVRNVALPLIKDPYRVFTLGA